MDRAAAAVEAAPLDLVEVEAQLVLGGPGQSELLKDAEHDVLAALRYVAHATTSTVEERLFVNRLGDLKDVMFARLKAGTNEDWHVAPRRQFMLCVRGIVEITAADGEKRRMTPGQFMLLEDLSGRGHRTHAVGDEDHVALALPVPEGIPAH